MSESGPPRRRLAAVLFADIVGFSTLASSDEDRALALAGLFRAVFLARVLEPEGRVVKFLGDGGMAVLDSAEAATRVACAILEDFHRAADEADTPATLRIGVHVGDVLEASDGDVYGEGVNTAARLQAAADPGEVLVSAAIWRQLRHRTAFALAPRGERQLKGAAAPEGVWAVLGVGELPPPGDPSARALGLDGSIRSSAPPVPPVPRSAGRLWALGVSGFVVLAVVGGNAILSRGSDAPSVDPNGTGDDPSATATRAVRAAGSSVAVLPFVDLSPAGDQAYFTDGIAEEILTVLTRIDGLHVVPRTTAFRYRSRDRSITEIGRELGVRAVLDGSVRTDGSRIRVAVQLLDAATDGHLWTEDFDREASGVFEVQEEVARAIAQALRVELLTPAGEAVFATTTPEVHRIYLRARHHMARRTRPDIERAVELLQEAVAADAGYAPAHAAAATAYFLLATYAGRRARDVIPLARAAAERALELDPALGEAHAVLGLVLQSFDYDWEGAGRAFRRAVELQPGDPSVHHFHAGYLHQQGRFDEAIRAWDRALELDPTSLIINLNRALPDIATGELNAAEAQLRRTLELDPDFLMARMWSAVVRFQRGEEDAAVADLESLPAEPVVLGYLGYAYGRVGRLEEAFAVARHLEAEPPEVGGYPLTLVYAGLGDADTAIDWLERIVDERVSFVSYAAIQVGYEDLHDHPRFQALLRRIGLHDVQMERPQRPVPSE